MFCETVKVCTSNYCITGAVLIYSFIFFVTVVQCYTIAQG